MYTAATKKVKANITRDMPETTSAVRMFFEARGRLMIAERASYRRSCASIAMAANSSAKYSSENRYNRSADARSALR